MQTRLSRQCPSGMHSRALQTCIGPVRRLASTRQCSDRHSPSAAATSATPGLDSAASKVSLHPEIGKVLFTEEVLKQRVAELGRQVGGDYATKDLLVLGVLKGAFAFTADLVRCIEPHPPHVTVDFLKASSYGMGTSSSGTLQVDSGFKMESVKGQHVLLVEDIIDTGNTLSRLAALLHEAGAASVRIAALLDKKARRKVTIDAEYVGFQCPDEFVVGYGIDYAEKYRQLPYIGVPKPEFIKH